MSVRISRATLGAVLAHAAAEPDREVCGLLFGAADRIDAAAPAGNAAADPGRHFEIDLAALFAAIRAERSGGPRIAGHYHSHPSGSAAPSARDAAAAHQPGRLWLIIAGDDAAFWREVPGGAVQGAFEPVRLVVDDGFGGCTPQIQSPQGPPSSTSTQRKG
ncbi:MAG TPA: Mov34/MPN/PAD-1 family protein [Sphingomonas sp.]|nr:Mov34/MPN/PAD-1 family protein [Sphingomonas sp.]